MSLTGSQSQLCRAIPISLQILTIQRTEGERGDYLLNSSLSLPPTSQSLRHLDIGRVITAENSPLRIGNSWSRARNLWFLSAIH